MVAEEIPILKQASDIHEDGSYSYSYETGNKIVGEESGTGGVSAIGSARWESPEGEAVELSYVADENGYQPTGSHIHAIPEAIVKALEWIKTHPYVEPKH